MDELWFNIQMCDCLCIQYVLVKHFKLSWAFLVSKLRVGSSGQHSERMRVQQLGEMGDVYG